MRRYIKECSRCSVDRSLTVNDGYYIVTYSSGCPTKDKCEADLLRDCGIVPARMLNGQIVQRENSQRV